MKRIILIVLTALLPFSSTAQQPQLFNAGFDTWSRSGGVWSLSPEKPSAAQQVWGTSNPGLSLLGINSTTPEYDHLAVSGKGKAAVRIESRNVLWAFVAGNIFTGKFVRLIKYKGAVLDLGIPFHARPKSLKGFYHYKPKEIDYAKEPFLSLKGRSDNGIIEIYLLDAQAPLPYNTTQGRFIDPKKDPRIIGYGKLEIRKGTEGYVRFDLPIDYRDDRTPGCLVLLASSSRYGQSFTGADGSVLYLDEFEFNY